MDLEKPSLPARVGDYTVARLMGAAAALPDPVALAVGRGLGRAGGWIQPKGDWVRRHMEIAFGSELDEAGIRRLAARFYEHMGLTFFELLRMRSWTRDDVLALTDVVGIEQVEREPGRGLIAISGHIGNWEIGAAAVAVRGYAPKVVMRPQRRSAFHDHMTAIRERHGVELIPRTSPRHCFACLRQGGNLGLLIDQRADRTGVFVPFFGVPASSPTGPAALALKTGARVVMISQRRVETGRHLVEFETIPVVDTGNLEADVLENTARFQLAIETAIRRAPEQWLWTFRRWGREPGRSRHMRRIHAATLTEAGPARA